MQDIRDEWFDFLCEFLDQLIEKSAMFSNTNTSRDPGFSTERNITGSSVLSWTVQLTVNP